MSDAASEPVFFDARLSPYRSLPPKGFFWVMALLSAIGFCAGIGFVLAGAWPVTGFFGLDVALVYLAFRLSYRSARQTETVRLTGAALDVERVSIRGEKRRWRFEPFWLRARLNACRVRSDRRARLVTVGRNTGHRLRSCLERVIDFS